MTNKNKFEEYNGLLFCRNCKSFVPKSHMNYRKVSENWSVSKCNTCMWFDRNKEKVNSINEFSHYEIRTLVHNMIYNETTILNDVANELNRSINDIILLYNILNIKGKKCLIRSTCEHCKIEIYDYVSVFLKNKNSYCSTACYYEDKLIKAERGEKNKDYNRISTICTNCEKPIKIIPSNYKKTNSYGDNHNFCCKECYWNYKSKYYVGNKAPISGHVFTEEERERCRINLLNRLNSNSRLNTSIQLKINQLLDENNIGYIREKIFDYYAVDNYLIDSNKIIEVMGDYYHCNPLKYNENKMKINEMQQKQIHRDKLKKSYILNNYNISILYLWEYDINNNINLCKSLIKRYINDDKLENYNSFNWTLKNNLLTLNENIIYPYFEQNINEYRQLYIS